MILTAYNPSLENVEKSYLSNSYAAGVTTVVVRNNDRFNANDRILLGEVGSEKAEIVTVGTVNADKITITVGATKFPHSADDPVYVLKYDQIKFYRSTTTIDGSYTELATVDIDVDNSDLTTRYDDANGLSSYFYGVSFYHSVTTDESALSDPYPGTGYSRLQLGYIINDFLTEVGDLEQQYMTVSQALNILNECNDDLTSQSRRPYIGLKTSALLNVTASDDRIPLPTDILAIDRIKYNYDFSGIDVTDNIRVVSIEEIEYIKQDNSAQTSDDLQLVAIDESTKELVLYPTPTTSQTGKIRLYYWKKFSTFDSLGDEIEMDNPRVYKMFLTARFYRMKAVQDSSFLPISDRYMNDYSSEVVKIQRLNRLDRNSPMGYKPDTGFKGLRK